MRSGAKVWLAFPALAATLVASEAHAQAPVEPIRTDIHTVAGCAEDPPFFDQIHARTANARRAGSNEEARTFQIVVTFERDLFVGRLTIVELGHASRPREVSAKACGDVLSALALIAALAIDPNALATQPAPAQPAPPLTAPPTPATSTATPTPPSTPTPTPNRTPTPTATATSLPPPPAPPSTSPAAAATPLADRRPSRDHPTPPPPSPPSNDRALWTLGAVFDLLAIGTTPVARAGIQMRRTWPRGPSLGLSLLVADGYHAIDIGGAHLLWATATLEGCPVRWSLTKSIALSPCLPLEGGVLSVGGAEVPNASVKTRPWLTVGALARVDIELEGRFFAELRGGVAFPLLRDTFYFLPGTTATDTAYQAPSVVGWGGIAAGVTIP